MHQHVDPLRQLRPMREEELDQVTRTHDSAAGPLAYDVYRAANELVIEVDVPGVEPADLELSVEDGTLVVVVRREMARGNGVDVIEAGRQHGTFRQRLVLGSRWDLDHLRAETRRGVLSVRAPLVTQAVRRHVPVAEAVGWPATLGVEVEGGTPGPSHAGSEGGHTVAPAHTAV